MTNYCWYYPYNRVDSCDPLALPMRIRMTELPAGANRIGNSRRFFTRPVPIKKFIWCNELDYCAGSPRLRKVSSRPGKHRHYMGGEWDKYYNKASHKRAKICAHRSARRKVRVYFRQVDPESDYNARLSYGLNEWDFS